MKWNACYISSPYFIQNHIKPEFGRISLCSNIPHFLLWYNLHVIYHCNSNFCIHYNFQNYYYNFQRSWSITYMLSYNSQLVFSLRLKSSESRCRGNGINSKKHNIIQTELDILYESSFWRRKKRLFMGINKY